MKDTDKAKPLAEAAALDQLADAKRAFAEGKTVQVDYGGIWVDIYDPGWNFGIEYRRKPEPSVRDWTQADVPAVCLWLKPVGTEDGSHLVTRVTAGGVHIDTGFITWSSLGKYFLHSTDLKTWKPCKVTE